MHGMLALVALAALAAPASARADGTVLVLLEAHDPLLEPLALELGEHGLGAVAAAPPGSRSAPERAREARVSAQAVGAVAAIWIDAAPDGRTALVRAVRADAPLDAGSPIPEASLADEPRAVALVAAALVDELLARQAPVVEAATPPTQAAPELAPAPQPAIAGPRVYGWLATGGFFRPAPFDAGGVVVRGSVGAEWADGGRMGAAAMFAPTVERAEIDGQTVGALAGDLAIGLECAWRAAAPGHVLHVGLHLLAGAAGHPGPGAAMAARPAFVTGVHAAVLVPVGRTAEVGFRIDADVWSEVDRGVTPALALSIEWGWR